MLTTVRAGTRKVDPISKTEKTKRSLYQERRLWHDSAIGTESLGCSTCRDRWICSGLRVQVPLFDCLDLCCGIARDCDRVCPNHPDFVDRVREVGSFSLNDVPRAPVLSAPNLPHLVPMIYHGTGRTSHPRVNSVAVPLYAQFDRRGARPRYRSKCSLSEAFVVPPAATILASGIDRDKPIERWWQLGEKVRIEIIHAMIESGVGMVTTPNYSLFTDRPRHDNLHAMKRIATVHEEFLRTGMPAALHVNGRTDMDFHHWREYVAARPEVTHIAYKFTTGTSWSGRIEQHAAWLVGLACAVGRPLHLILRGGMSQIPMLSSAFARLTLVDTSIFMKTIKRQRAYARTEGKLGWESHPTRPGTSLDSLFETNLRVSEARIASLIAQPANRSRLAGCLR